MIEKNAKISNFVLIIGAMKCGTTSLYNYLIQHPAIAPCYLKEVGFFNKPAQFSKGFDFYRNLWDWNPEQHKYALEATPGYSRVTHPTSVNAAENILKTANEHRVNFKFIYILRNPIDRIESHYTQGRKHNHRDTAKSLEAGIEREIIDTSKYAMQIKEYYQRFPSKDILLINFEILKQNPNLLLNNICKFLNIDLEYQFQSQLAYNSYSKKLSRVAIPGYSRLRKTNFVRNKIKFMPKGLKDKAHLLRNFMAREHEYEYVKLSAEQKRYVCEELKPDLRELQTKYNFDIDSWGIEV